MQCIDKDQLEILISILGTDEVQELSKRNLAQIDEIAEVCKQSSEYVDKRHLAEHVHTIANGTVAIGASNLSRSLGNLEFKLRANDNDIEDELSEVKVAASEVKSELVQIFQ